MVAAAALNFLLPGKFTLGPPWLVPVLEMAILIPLYISSPVRRADESRWQSIFANLLIAIANVANISSLVLLVKQIVFNTKVTTGPELLFSSLAIWLTNILVFSLWFWELDRGGPDDRLRDDHGPPDFLFPQMVTPADVMPLTRWAKMMMLAEAVVSLATITIVASRAVNIIS